MYWLQVKRITFCQGNNKKPWENGHFQTWWTKKDGLRSLGEHRKLASRLGEKQFLNIRSKRTKTNGRVQIKEFIEKTMGKSTFPNLRNKWTWTSQLERTSKIGFPCRREASFEKSKYKQKSKMEVPKAWSASPQRWGTAWEDLRVLMLFGRSFATAQEDPSRGLPGKQTVQKPWGNEGFQNSEQKKPSFLATWQTVENWLLA